MNHLLAQATAPATTPVATSAATRPTSRAFIGSPGKPATPAPTTQRDIHVGPGVGFAILAGMAVVFLFFSYVAWAMSRPEPKGQTHPLAPFFIVCMWFGIVAGAALFGFGLFVLLAG